MTFKELLEHKKISGYLLSKKTGIPYTTINDLINGRTIIQNTSLKYALLIAECLNIDIKELNNIDSYSPIEFRYFRNNLLSDLKREGEIEFANKIIKDKEIDFYYKNHAKEYAYYLLALLDYLYNKNNIPIYQKRYNELRKQKLDRPFFVGSNLISFDTLEDAEDKLGITIIPEFGKYNIIEEDIYNVA